MMVFCVKIVTSHGRRMEKLVGFKIDHLASTAVQKVCLSCFIRENPS